MSKISEGMKLVAEGLAETFSNFFKGFNKAIEPIFESVDLAVLTDKEIRKFQMIRGRTKKKRIKKKQDAKIEKRLEEIRRK